MRNVRLSISYDGTRYAGWQFQKNAKSIQQVLESLLKKIMGHTVKLRGSGRTDSGVHARYQVANFRTNSKLPINKIKAALNSALPDDILVNSIEQVSSGFDAQRCAKSKHYRYTVTTSHFVDPFIRHFVARFSYPLNISRMRRSAATLVGRHDFKAFQASGSKEKNTIRTIKNIKVERCGDLVYIDVCADGFLYNMVRTISGTLLEIGRGKLSESIVNEILKTKTRALVGPTAPAKGLCLMKVEY
ncbi:MAG: tRNA pseudouridine(38-40) synthase TruA [Candidatus Omnitrophota bacterium]|nr:tRNA pseudouridine(38-40) synthase TruA [Candidatus Omnitrophota bacterium]